MRTFIGTLLLAFIFISCETKVDLVAEGEESPIVFGFMDANADTQFVKITKSFVTEGNAFEAAQDQSLSEYEDLEAWIIEYDGSDSIDAFLLQEKLVSNKDSGAFYYPYQTVYYTDEISFEDDDSRYDHEFEIQFEASGKKVSSKTSILHPFIPNNSHAFEKVSFVTLFDVAGSNYQNKELRVDRTENVKRYECTLRFHYTEIYVDGSQEERFMDFKKPAWVYTGVKPNHEFVFKGEEFFLGVQSRLIAQDNEENVTRRVIGKLEYIFEYAGFELNTYIELNQPATSFNSEQNPYTNIENGVGVWSARGFTIFSDKKLETKSIEELVEGQYTAGYKFCSDDPGHSGLSYGCN